MFCLIAFLLFKETNWLPCGSNIFLLEEAFPQNPASILYKSIAGRYRPVRVADRPITTRYRFIKNAYWERTWCAGKQRAIIQVDAHKMPQSRSKAIPRNQKKERLGTNNDKQTPPIQPPVHEALRKHAKYIEKFRLQKLKIFRLKKNISHTSGQNIDCRYSLEPPRRGGSN